MGSRGSQDLNMRVAENSPYLWGGTSHTSFMLGDGEIYPPGIVTAAEVIYTTPLSPAGINTIEYIQDFEVIVPEVYDAISQIDGIIKGNIKVGVEHWGGVEHTTLTKIDLIIKKVDSAGISTSVLDETVWTGSLQATTTTEVNLTTRYYSDIYGAVVNSSDRLVIVYRCTLSVYSVVALSYGVLHLHCTDETYENSVSLPIVMR